MDEKPKRMTLKQILDAASREVKTWPEWMQKAAKMEEHRREEITRGREA